jgi:hypothetical protein
VATPQSGPAITLLPKHFAMQRPTRAGETALEALAPIHTFAAGSPHAVHSPIAPYSYTTA